MSEHERLLGIVRSVRRRWRLKMLLRGVAVLLLAAAALLLAAGWVIDASRFDATAVAVVRGLAYLAFAIVLLRVLVWPLVRRVSDERVALYLEEHEPTLGGRVSSAVELGREPDGSVSTALVERLVRSAVDECRKVDDGRRVERAGLWRSSALAAGSTVFGLGLFLLGPAFLGHTTPVLLDPWKKPELHNPYAIAVEPGDAALAKGADLEVTAELQGFDAAEAELAVRAGESDWTRWSMLREGSVFRLLVFDLQQPTEYFVEASGVRSPVYKVEVTELPYVGDIRLTYRFPPYTGLDPVEQPGSGDVTALVGTEVALEVTPTLPVAGGVLELEDGATLPLTVNEEGRLDGTITVGGEPGSYHALFDWQPAADAAPRRVVASPDYVIDPVADQPPTVTLAKPGRDVQVTSLEEVVTEIRAQDDYGVVRVDLVYAVNGGDEAVATLYDSRPGRKDFAGTHTLYLEEHELEPGDLVSYYARTWDGEGGVLSHETVSDIYFLEIRPFDRNFRQADAGAMPGQGAMSGGELSAQQRLIIAATFKLSRARDDEASRDGLATVALSQVRLRQQVTALVERLGGETAGTDSPFEWLPKAAEQMSEAEEALGERRPDAALAPEQKALQYLQRVEASLDLQVAQGGAGGGGGQGEISDELTDLFELERDRLRNQYEQVQRSRQQQTDDAVDELLEKLRELARRQQQENERMRALASRADRQTRTGSSGESQRRLAEEAEEVARKLERLAREESLPDLAETARQLREAVEQMRHAAAAGERTGEALGSSALDRLRQARRQLEQSKSRRLRRDTAQALERARRLRREQERMVERVDRIDPYDPGYDDTLRDLMEAKERMGAEVGSLEAGIDQMSRDSRREQPEASRRLQAAAEEIRDDKIREKILYSRGVVQQRSREYARNFEEHIAGTLGELEKRLEEVAGAIGESREQRLGRALEQTREAVTALESLEERLRAGGPGSPTDSGGPPQGGSAAVRPRDLRQYVRELNERRAQLERLRGDLEREGIEAPDLERILERIRELGSTGALAGPETVAALERDVVQGLKEFEYDLRRSLGVGGEERPLQIGDGEVPEGYEEMVEKYYKALAGEE